MHHDFQKFCPRVWSENVANTFQATTGACWVPTRQRPWIPCWFFSVLSKQEATSTTSIPVKISIPTWASWSLPVVWLLLLSFTTWEQGKKKREREKISFEFTNQSETLRQQYTRDFTYLFPNTGMHIPASRPIPPGRLIVAIILYDMGTREEKKRTREDKLRVYESIRNASSTIHRRLHVPILEYRNACCRYNRKMKLRKMVDIGVMESMGEFQLLRLIFRWERGSRSLRSAITFYFFISCVSQILSKHVEVWKNLTDVASSTKYTWMLQRRTYYFKKY